MSTRSPVRCGAGEKSTHILKCGNLEYTPEPSFYGILVFMKITVLGSGTSHGIPVIGCGCGVCTSRDSRDRRMRASVFVEGSGGECIVIDTGPEFRLQAVAAKIKKLDAVLFTHSHADHLHGLDDVRPLTRVGRFGFTVTAGQ